MVGESLQSMDTTLIRSRALGMVILLASVFCGTPLKAQLNLQFDNAASGYDPTNIYITFQNGIGTPFDVTYGGGTSVTFGSTNDIMSESLTLAQIGTNGFTVSSVSSVGVFISYGSAISNKTNAPGFFAGTPSSDLRWQNFEITRTGGSGDQGNLTAINYFTSPLGITSYNGTTVLQSRSFNPGQTATVIGSQLAVAAGNNTNAIVKDTNGNILRYIGPSTFTSNAPYSTFTNYLQAISTAGQATAIVNSNAFNGMNGTGSGGVAGSTNFNYKLNLSATVATNNTISMTGNITTQVTPFGGNSTSGTTYTNASVTISGTDENILNSIIYGQTVGSFTNSVSWGSGWTDMYNDMTTVFGLTDGLANFQTTQRLAIGEITSGILMGFLNSTNTVAQYGSTQLKDLESYQWWQLDPMVAFSSVQSVTNFYNQWANIIYGATSNQAYSIPYSDRMGTGPLINSVQFGGTNVDKWIVDIGTPVGAPIPEAKSAIYVTLAILGFAFFMASKKKRTKKTV